MDAARTDPYSTRAAASLKQPSRSPTLCSEPSIYSYRHVRRFARLPCSRALEEERDWCVGADRGRRSPRGAGRAGAGGTLAQPADSARRRQTCGPSRCIAQATRRGARHRVAAAPASCSLGSAARASVTVACLTEGHLVEDATDEDEDWTGQTGQPIGSAAWAGRLIDVRQPGYRAAIADTQALIWGWYGEIEDADELESRGGLTGTRRSRDPSRTPPMPAAYVGHADFARTWSTSSTESMDRHGGCTHWYRDAETTDELTALRWVVEGDGDAQRTVRRLSRRSSSCLPTVQWGPEANAEYDLWYRAFEALTPQ